MSLNQKREKNDTRFWDEHRGIIRSRKGGWVIGEIIHNHGYSTMDDLVGEKSFFQVLVLNVTGRMPERRMADWLDGVFNCVSWPDARIWCNQIGSLAGTMRASPAAGVCAGLLASDSTMYGVRPTVASAEFIIDAMTKKSKGMSAEMIVDEYPRRRPYIPPKIPGYARPFAKGDERIHAMERVSAQLGFERGEHLALAYEIEEVLLQKYDEAMNFSAYVAAFLTDQGFSPRELYSIISLAVNTGIHACYSEAADNPPESFLPMRCEDIDYQGKPLRPLPDDK